MKKIIIIIFLLLLSGCRTTDSIMFKNEFEKLNSNSNYVTVKIESNNPFVYISASELVKKIENKEDLIVLFGYSKSNETRSIIDDIIRASKSLNIDKIYYLDILDIRDYKTINENKEVVVTKEGSNEYNKLLLLLDSNLNDYIVNNNIVGSRIYASNILVLKNKKIEGVITPKSNLETEEEKNKEIYEMIYEHLKKYNNNTCDLEEAC